MDSPAAPKQPPHSNSSVLHSILFPSNLQRKIAIMQLKSILFNVALSSFLSAASADCQLSNSIINTDKFNKHSDDEKLCLSQGEGTWTFSMEISEVNFPSFDADNPFAGFVSNKGFAIYDHTCALKGSYDPGNDGNDCGTPYIIMENFLTQVLTITGVNFDAANGKFSFDYGDGTYVIDNNGCDCVDASDGLRAAAKCKCAFPLDGTFDGKRRSIEFKA